jgi:hypothetical protein
LIEDGNFVAARGFRFDTEPLSFCYNRAVELQESDGMVTVKLNILGKLHLSSFLRKFSGIIHTVKQ